MKSYTQAELNNLKTADIVGIYNAHAETMGATIIKKFRDKATAISRTLVMQEKAIEEYEKTTKVDLEAEAEAESEKPAKSKKPAKGNSKTEMSSKVEIATPRDTREGSIGHMMFGYINENQELGLTVQELVDYMVANYSKPRSDVPITKGFVVDTIRYFLRNGNIKLS